MEIIIGILVEFLGSLLLEGLLEVISRFLKRIFTNFNHPVLLGGFYFLLGSIAGGLSLWILPQALIADQLLRFINLIFIPLFIGLIMMSLGKLLKSKGKTLTSLDHFSYAFIFAFGIALVRFIVAN